jgi:lysophospholipase L1-like esterase
MADTHTVRELPLSADVDTSASSSSNTRSALAVRLAWGLLTLAACLLGAELAARLDDVLFHAVPFFANPRYDDLIMRDWFGRRGRPHAQFRNWKLNSLGFRGPEIAVDRTPGCARVVVMGASETFGYYESPGHEFPSLLGKKLATRGCTEVVNTAVIGMMLASMHPYWTYWVARLHPDVVVIYPSPLFYLASWDPGAPKAPIPVTAHATMPRKSVADAGINHPFESRFIQRLRGVVSSVIPRWVSMYRSERDVRAELAEQPARPEIRSPPPQALAGFGDDLRGLVEAIRASGAHVVLLTHAQRASLPIERRALPDLWEARIWAPDATLAVFVAFDRAGNDIVRETARQESVQLIDAAAVLNGRFDCFADLNHFDDKGSEVMASLIAQQLRISGH